MSRVIPSMSASQTDAIVLRAPGDVGLQTVGLVAPGSEDVVVDVRHSAISTGTERLLWSGEMPPFPGLSYPLVPGYEAVGTIVEAGDAVSLDVGDTAFVPGARCYTDAAGLFGASASRLIAPASRVKRVDAGWVESATLLALAATAHRAVTLTDHSPELIVGHGVLGRLAARIVRAIGHPAPTVWEHSKDRRGGAIGYEVVSEADDDRHDYRVVCDMSGDNAVLDRLIARTAKGGEVVLAGFYAASLSFAFPPAFMRGTSIRIAAEFTPADIDAVTSLVASGALDLEGLITHRMPATEAANAYATAFGDPSCLKMILDWSDAR